MQTGQRSSSRWRNVHWRIQETTVAATEAEASEDSDRKRAKRSFGYASIVRVTSGARLSSVTVGQAGTQL